MNEAKIPVEEMTRFEVRCAGPLLKRIRHEAKMKGISYTELIRQILWKHLDDVQKHQEQYTMAMMKLQG